MCCSLQNDQLPLPIKRISEVDDSSSISDDDETCNNSSCVPDSASQPKVCMYVCVFINVCVYVCIHVYECMCADFLL